jgi:thiosulfate dehydrogenase
VKARLLFAVLLFAGCSEPALQEGRRLFSSPSLSPAGDNVFSCATCHDITTIQTRIRPGYTVYDAFHRSGWWGGNELTFFDSVNECVKQFMADQPNGLSPMDESGRALLVYLESLAPDASAPLLPLTVVQNIVDVPSGSAANGAAVWQQGCATCHGAPHTGQGRITPLAALVPDDSLAAHGTDPKTGARPVTIEKVRHGKFYNVGGRMPLFSKEALSDAQLGDLLAYLEMFGLPPSPPP